MNDIKRNLTKILAEIPEGIELVAAAKTRTADEVLQAIAAGIKIVGENYVQESLKIIEKVGPKARWHFIGHLQTNKVKYAVPVYDMIETVDSIKLANTIDKIAKKYDKIMLVLIEINSGREPQKFGVMPENTEKLLKAISNLSNIKIVGLMTMGPRFGEPEKARPYFKETKKIFDKIKDVNIPNVEMKYLSMGMSNSYKIAIEEGANMVRIGTKIFGERKDN
ncbi:MAG: YggS family pyridoxal phosphate-dependent enzyme [Candidatus Cloacimonetes bacterium]|nr:YggS family pyridoxal phosphate-dependent enzyme [Candidatus Cloacimonadota bacterium]MBL7086731.1 YggS family pyridoxal phosphate-dependent enzyme [Candidatus Cloacimonadota bacterium]